MKSTHTSLTDLEQFAGHLKAIVFKNVALRNDIKERTRTLVFQAQHFSLLEPFASAALADDLRYGELNWWQAFADHMAQKIPSLCIPPAQSPRIIEEQNDALFHIIVTTEWNVANFQRLPGVSTDGMDPPPYPAHIEKIDNLPMFLSYQEKRLLPLMKQTLSDRLGLSLAELENRLEQMAIDEKKERAPGIAIFIPLGTHPDQEDYMALCPV